MRKFVSRTKNVECHEYISINANNLLIRLYNLPKTACSQIRAMMAKCLKLLELGENQSACKMTVTLTYNWPWTFPNACYNSFLRRYGCSCCCRWFVIFWQSIWKAFRSNQRFMCAVSGPVINFDPVVPMNAEQRISISWCVCVWAGCGSVENGHSGILLTTLNSNAIDDAVCMLLFFSSLSNDDFRFARIVCAVVRHFFMCV